MCPHPGEHYTQCRSRRQAQITPRKYVCPVVQEEEDAIHESKRADNLWHHDLSWVQAAGNGGRVLPSFSAAFLARHMRNTGVQ